MAFEEIIASNSFASDEFIITGKDNIMGKNLFVTDPHLSQPPNQNSASVSVCLCLSVSVSVCLSLSHGMPLDTCPIVEAEFGGFKALSGKAD